MYNFLPYGTILYNQPYGNPVLGAADLLASSELLCSSLLRASGGGLMVGGAALEVSANYQASGVSNLEADVHLEVLGSSVLSASVLLEGIGVLDVSFLRVRFTESSLIERSSTLVIAAVIAAGKSQPRALALLGCDSLVLRWLPSLVENIVWGSGPTPEVDWDLVETVSGKWRS